MLEGGLLGVCIWPRERMSSVNVHVFSERPSLSLSELVVRLVAPRRFRFVLEAITFKTGLSCIPNCISAQCNGTICTCSQGISSLMTKQLVLIPSCIDASLPISKGLMHLMPSLIQAVIHHPCRQCRACIWHFNAYPHWLVLVIYANGL